MDSFYLVISSALGLGILTSISPCPLASNIVALSYMSSHLDKKIKSFIMGISYSIGRILAYTFVGFLIVQGFFEISALSFFLQKYLNVALGPILILASMVILNLISFSIPGFVISDKTQKKLASSGVLGALGLGFIFALAFCPVSAALFFGSLIPLSIKESSVFLLPSIYGLGTALPVIAIAVLLAFTSQSVATVFGKIKVVEKWARNIAGVTMLIIGIYFCLQYIYKVF